MLQLNGSFRIAFVEELVEQQTSDFYVLFTVLQHLRIVGIPSVLLFTIGSLEDTQAVTIGFQTVRPEELTGEATRPHKAIVGIPDVGINETCKDKGVQTTIAPIGNDVFVCQFGKGGDVVLDAVVEHELVAVPYLRMKELDIVVEILNERCPFLSCSVVCPCTVEFADGIEESVCFDV
jgi:hypothetical protein